MMPSSSNGLTRETFACKAFSILTFFYFLRCKTVAVCREGPFCIGLGKPFFAEEPSFDLSELNVGGFWNAGIVTVEPSLWNNSADLQHIDPIPKILEKALYRTSAYMEWMFTHL